MNYYHITPEQIRSNLAERLAAEHNALVDQVNKFNDGVSYASKAQIGA